MVCLYCLYLLLISCVLVIIILITKNIYHCHSFFVELCTPYTSLCLVVPNQWSHACLVGNLDMHI